MTKPNFTPGPWELSLFTFQNGEEGYEIFPADKEDEYRIAKVYDESGPNRLDANAHLIAAAPDLYDLANIVAQLNKDPGTIGPGMLNALVDMAAYITKKARGEA